MVTTIFGGAFAFAIGFDVGVSKFWDHWNRGVSLFQSNYFPFLVLKMRSAQKQWKDIRGKYIENAE
jgi:hypothetical protein